MLKVPTHLLEGSQAWLQGLKDDREWTPSQWRLLLLAAEAWDRSQTARRTLTREGLTVTAPILSKKGEVVGERITAHPAAAIAATNASLFAKLVGQLGLDANQPGLPADPEVPEGEGQQPPAQPDIFQRLAFQAAA